MSNSEERHREEVVFYDVIFVVSASGPQWWLGCLKVQRRMSGDIYDDWDGLPDHLASAITFYMVSHQPPATGQHFRGKAQPIFSVQ